MDGLHRSGVGATQASSKAEDNPVTSTTAPSQPKTAVPAAGPKASPDHPRAASPCRAAATRLRTRAKNTAPLHKLVAAARHGRGTHGPPRLRMGSVCRHNRRKPSLRGLLRHWRPHRNASKKCADHNMHDVRKGAQWCPHGTTLLAITSMRALRSQASSAQPRRHATERESSQRLGRRPVLPRFVARERRILSCNSRVRCFYTHARCVERCPRHTQLVCNCRGLQVLGCHIAQVRPNAGHTWPTPDEYWVSNTWPDL